MKKAMLFFTALPAMAIYLIPAAVFRLAWGRKVHSATGEKAWYFLLRGDSWPARTWYRAWAATTLGYAVMICPEHTNDIGLTRAHEFVHVRQFEAECLASFILALPIAAFSPWAAAAVWTLGHFAVLLGTYLAAWLNGQRFYTDSVREEAGRAIPEMHRSAAIEGTR